MKEEAASLVDKTGQDRQKLSLQGWRLCHDSPVSTFQKRRVAVLQGEHAHPFEIEGMLMSLRLPSYG